MKKVLFLVLVLLPAIIFAQPWGHRYDVEQVSQNIIVDINTPFTVSVEWGEGDWDADGSKFGYGISTDGTDWTWVNLPWFEDGSGSNKRCKSILSISIPGKYYYAYRMDKGGTSYSFGGVDWAQNSTTLSAVSTIIVGKVSKADGSWTNTASWEDGIIPTSSSNVAVMHDLSLSGVTGLANSIYIYSGSSFSVEVDGELTISGNFSNNGTVTIQSDATGTGSLITNGSITGNVTVERYIPAWGTSLQGWHLLSSPVSSQAFQPTFVSDPPSSSEDFYLWDETTNYWINSKVGTEAPYTFNAVFGSNFVVGQGYLASYGSSSNKDFVGTPNTSTVSDIALTYTSSSGRKGSNLLGNPYPCGIVWNVETWKPDNTTISGVAKVLSSADASYTDIAVDEIIPAMNGFFVYTNEATTLSIPSSAKTHGGTWFKNPTTTQKLVLTAVDIEGETAQKSVISINPNASQSYDLLYDGVFARFYAPAFYSKVGDYKLSTNAIPSLPDNLVVPFYFEKNEGASYRIEASGVETMGVATTLLDKKTGITTDLNVNSSYEFTSEEGDNPDRFEIHFGVVGIDDQRTTPTIQAYVYGQQLKVLGNGGITQLDIFDVQGRLLSSETINVMDGYSKTLNLQAGMYVVRLQNKEGVSSTKVIIK
jgi:hypothetical protein